MYWNICTYTLYDHDNQRPICQLIMASLTDVNNHIDYIDISKKILAPWCVLIPRFAPALSPILIHLITHPFPQCHFVVPERRLDRQSPRPVDLLNAPHRVAPSLPRAVPASARALAMRKCIKYPSVYRNMT